MCCHAMEDGYDASGLQVYIQHLQRFLIGASGRLFAKHVLAGAHRVYGDSGMHFVGRADANRLHFGIDQNVVIVLYSDAAAVFLHAGLSFFGNDVAEVFDLRVGVRHISGDVSGIGDGSAADDADLHGNVLLYDDAGILSHRERRYSSIRK